MRAAIVGVLVGLTGCDRWRGPACDEVTTAALAVDASGEVPVFTFDGDRPHYLEVFEGDVTDTVATPFDWAAGDLAWAIDCPCLDRTGEIGCVDALDLERRACVASGTAYGDGGGRAVVTAAAQPLRPGRTYTVVVGSYCHGDRHHLDGVNGGDAFHENHTEQLAVFTAP